MKLAHEHNFFTKSVSKKSCHPMMKKKIGYFPIPLLIIPLLLCLISYSNCSELLYPYCSSDSMLYSPNGKFQNNLKLLLQILPSKTAPTGFNNTSFGYNPDYVYGQALCRGDVNSTVCQNCVEIASQAIFNSCRTLDAIIWYDLCQVHYSFQDFFSGNIYTGQYPPWNDQQKNVSNHGNFNDVLTFLLKNLSSEASYNPSKKMFATGEIEFSKKQKIYGLLQCTRDLEGDKCSNCLNSAFSELMGCCSSKEGGMILSRNCIVRFELKSFYNMPSNLLIYTGPKGEKWKVWMIVLVASLMTIVVAILAGCCIVAFSQKAGNRKDDERSEKALLHELASPVRVGVTEEGDLVSSEELPFQDFTLIRTATDNFSDMNKLGQGAFGSVYKGVFPDGKEIAVKRLSRTSWQGLNEFKNEIILIAKLQHRNLVRLLGCGLEGEEKLLIYEFMPNRSLDFFIFDYERRTQLDWKTYYNIITGIAKGILYLHEDSRLKIIHRDLKPSNVLLDDDMVAKISDFGMARIFGENQNTANTRRVVGTFGYMAPEYAMAGLFSVKSDVFSFGVILLEIISGQKNSGFYLTQRAQTLLAYAWQLWIDGNQLEFIDPLLVERGPIEEVERCIHIGLLCVQEDPADRPKMSSVVAMLESEALTLPQPKKPAFSVGRMIQVELSSTTDPSVNQITVSSVISPR